MSETEKLERAIKDGVNGSIDTDGWILVFLGSIASSLAKLADREEDKCTLGKKQQKNI